MNDKYSGMTVNERLYHSGNLKAFDLAVKKKDKDQIILIMKKIELDKESIDTILKHYKLRSNNI